MRAIEDIVRSERQAGRSTLLTSLKQRLMRRMPGFDEKKLGFSGFKKLMQRVAQEGNVKLVTVGLVDWVVLSDEVQVEEAVPETREAAPELVSAGEPPEAATEPVPDTEHPAGEHQPTSTNGRRKRHRAAAVTEQAQESIRAPVDTASPVVADTLKELDLPNGPGDGQDAQRVADLIVMADTLEHQEGVSHVAFNFLVSEVSNALQQGLEAQHDIITQHWGEMHSRNYVTTLLRALGNGGLFQRGWHTGKNKETGRSTRRSTFNLNREHPLVQQVLQAQWNATQYNEVPSNLELPQGTEEHSEPGYESLLEPGEDFSLSPEDQPQGTEAQGNSGIGRVMRLFSRS